MPLVINTNIQSLNAQRNLSKTLTPLQTAMQRLSSGLRINSAKDDAAGLAIAVRMDAQMKGLNQAVRNANDAVSLVQTAEGAIDEMTNAMQRIRELAVQSANASNTALDRSATDKEVQQLVQEIDRIATQTQFNNQTLLDGTLGSKAFQVGANAGQTINVSLTQGLRSSQIGQIASATGGSSVTANALADGGVTIAIGTGTAVSIGASTAGTGAGQTSDSAYAKVQAINGSGVAGLTATAQNSVASTWTAITPGAGVAYDLTINNQAIYTNFDATVAGPTGAEVAAQVNLYSATTGVSASFAAGSITFSTADGRNINIMEDTTAGEGLQAAVGDTVAVATRGTITLSASEDITMTGAYADLGFAAATIIKDSTTLSSVNVNTVTNANDTINRIDAALNVISNMRADLGAVMNRFQSTTSNLQNVLENITAAHSRIMDADFAAETANITKAQILQQAGISVLAQANSLPQNVLTLLRQ
ncbi:MAG: flagellin N-terminal helical domain-containing protein [Candidatus Aquicultor sp.]